MKDEGKEKKRDHKSKTERLSSERSGRTVAFKDTKNLVSSHKSDLGNTMRVTESDTDL